MNLPTIICFFTILFAPITANGCTLSIANLPTNFPLILQENSIDFLYPEIGTKDITLSVGDTIELSCPQSTLTQTDTTTAIAICSSNGQFQIDGNAISIANVTCKKKPTNTARYTGQQCTKNIKQIEIGFDIDTNRFLTLIIVCFNEAKRDPVYAYYNLTKFIDNYDTTVERPTFTEEQFYNLTENLNTLYTKTMQRETINKQLDLPANSEDIIASGNYYLAKGHLTAKTDFVYGPAQTATFHFVNTAPQWQNFNSMNWLKTENGVRALATTRQQNLVVYTGIYGILTLSDNKNGDNHGLYLYTDNFQAITIPELFWKLVYEPETKSALVIFGINNPYIQDPQTSIICTDISDQITWLSDGRDDIEAGYIYTCTYDEVYSLIEGFPTLNVNNVLN